MSTDWKMSGTYFETCNCEAACPCVFLSDPSEGECTVLVAWHIDDGRFGDVKLDGLNLALAIHSPGNMAKTKWRAGVYVDEKAGEAQKNALLTVFSGKAGGHPAVLASFVGEILGAKSVPMRYEASGKRRSLTIPGAAEARIAALEGQGGKEVRIENHPLCIAPGEAAIASRSERFTLSDFGMNVNLSGRTGFYSPFRYSS